MMKEKDEKSIGKQKSRTIQKTKLAIKVILSFEKKKKAIPTTPYIFTKNPIAIKSVAQKVFPFSTKIYAKIMNGSYHAINLHILYRGHHFNGGSE